MSLQFREGFLGCYKDDGASKELKQFFVLNFVPSTFSKYFGLDKFEFYGDVDVWITDVKKADNAYALKSMDSSCGLSGVLLYPKDDYAVINGGFSIGSAGEFKFENGKEYEVEFFSRNRNKVIACCRVIAEKVEKFTLNGNPVLQQHEFVSDSEKVAFDESYKKFLFRCMKNSDKFCY